MDYVANPVTPPPGALPPIAVQMLIAVARCAGQPGTRIPYAPAEWFGKVPTVRNRARWSRWTHRLALHGLLQRHVDFGRDRVRRVSLTPLGWNWVISQCGPGAVECIDFIDVEIQ